MAKLKPWMEGDAKGFAAAILAEAEELKAESYGAELLQHVCLLVDLQFVL